MSSGGSGDIGGRAGDLIQRTTVKFSTMIARYAKIQSQLMVEVRNLASNITSAQPGQFLLLQFQMSTVAQVGESISNMVSQVMSIINNAIRNQKSA